MVINCAIRQTHLFYYCSWEITRADMAGRPDIGKHSAFFMQVFLGEF